VISRRQTSSGENRPDLRRKTPGRRFIIVDAKVPDFDFFNALESASGKRAGSAGGARGEAEGHHQGAGERVYPSIPERAGLRRAVRAGESLFSAALEGDPTI